jgi:hypothetical protein
MDEVLKIDEDLVEEYLKRSKDRRKLWDDLDAADAVERKAGGEIIEGKDGGREEDDDGEKPPSKRMTYERENYRESCWWKFIQRDNLDDLNSRDGKTFRNRFTVPFQLFLELLTMAKTWFPQREFDVFGKEVSPIELKLLGSLRILGKGCSWDLLYELSGVSAEVHRRWTLAFIKKFSLDMYPIYVHGPRDNAEMENISGLYAASGFPGCIGSTDCVHIRWEKCPSVWATAYRNGKNNYTSIAYEMTVSHSKKFQATTVGHYGTTSDKTIVKFDGFVQKIKLEKRYTNAEYELQIGPNKWITEKGVYLLVDGGYHKWRILQCPIKHTPDMDEIRWSEFAESIRKDVECSFGILKKRFQLLKNGINWHNKTDIDHAVFSCVILHNMLHEFDGYDERWENELYNAHNDKEEQAMLDKIRKRVVRTAENKDDYSTVGRLFANINNIQLASSLDEGDIEYSDKFEDLRHKLVKHITNQYLEGKLEWIQI